MGSFIAEGVRVYEASASDWLAGVRVQPLGAGGLWLHLCIHQVRWRTSGRHDREANVVLKAKLDHNPVEYDTFLSNGGFNFRVLRQVACIR